LPETALPILRNDMPESYADMLREHARRQGGDVLVGAFEQEGGLFYNSMFSLGSSASQHYRKNHMVPFGEFIPLRPVFGWLINEVLNIPMGDLSSGGEHQPLLNLAGQHIAMNICYEDVFGEEIIRALPQATLLVNASNFAWFGDSLAPHQHLQIARLRALETGRVMLRATNTGMTAIVDQHGRVTAALAPFTEGSLSGSAQGRSGATPYVRWGNAPVVTLALIVCGLLALRRRGSAGMSA
jgi:apolipoprotein N-acyltransferase